MFEESHMSKIQEETENWQKVAMVRKSINFQSLTFEFMLKR